VFDVGVAAGGAGPPGEPGGGERGPPALGPPLEGGGGTQPPPAGGGHHHQLPRQAGREEGRGEKEETNFRPTQEVTALFRIILSC
jgi:hypothetical protein